MKIEMIPYTDAGKSPMYPTEMQRELDRKINICQHEERVESQIRRLAREFWIAAGRPEGRDKEFWYQAEDFVFGRNKSFR